MAQTHGGDKQGGNGVPCPSPAAHSPSCHRDRKFITVIGTERRCPSGKSYPASKDSLNGKERGNLGRKDFRTPASNKGNLIQKCSVVSLHKVKIKDTPSLRYSERKIMLGRKGRGCGKG